MEVVVRRTIPPVIVKNDTIAFNAGAYPTRANATVEDMLKKLPGIEIDKDGNVTMQGQKVDKIYLDGKEFFLNDPRTASRNLPADIVAQIEAFDSQTDQGRMTGVRDATGNKTLNIKLKKDRKQGYFGNAYAGVGTEGGWASGGNATRLGASRWLFGNAQANNINNQFSGKENATGPGSGMQSFTHADLNIRQDWGNATHGSLNLGEDGSRTELTQGTILNSFFTDSSLLEHRTSGSINSNTSYHADAQLDWKIDSFYTLRYTGKWSTQKGSSDSQDSVNVTTEKAAAKWLSSEGLTENRSDLSGYNLGNTVLLQRRFRKRRRSLVLGITQSAQAQDNHTSLYTSVRSFDSVGASIRDTAINQQSVQSSPGHGYGASLSYTEPMGARHVLDIGYRANVGVNSSNKTGYDYDSATRRFDRVDSAVTNRFLTKNTTQMVNAAINGLEGRVKYQLGIGWQFTDLRNDNSTLGHRLDEHFSNFFPRASMIYNISRGSNFSVQYLGKSVSPTIDQLQPLPDLSNPFLVRIGNPALQQEFDHHLSATFSSFTLKNLRNWQWSGEGEFAQNKIVSATTLLPGGIQQVEYVNVEGSYTLGSRLTYGFPLGHGKGNGNIGVRGGYSRNINIVNEKKEIGATTLAGGTLKLNYHPVAKLFAEMRASADYTGAKYSAGALQSSRSWLQHYAVDVSYDLPLAVTVSSNVDLQVISGQSGLPPQTTTIWNAAIYHVFLRSRSLQLRLSVFDILGAASNYSQSVGVNYLETRRSNLPGRLYLLSLMWHFKKFSS
ncbi:MAG: outer membrane beta-barrel protein [Bacteroidota bacterium]|nr:outer membrane beta-barrel protein [Bacteroidota bacterium]MDP4258072.1 outer membrane beta-barrel protein [Bacteroidota bacterium]